MRKPETNAERMQNLILYVDGVEITDGKIFALNVPAKLPGSRPTTQECTEQLMAVGIDTHYDDIGHPRLADKPRTKDALIEVVGAEVADVILNGRSRLSILLNSPGGHAYGLSGFEKICRHIQSRGGIVDAYVTSKAYSAAATLFLQANNRYCLDSSRFMWHCGRRDPNLDEISVAFDDGLTDDDLAKIEEDNRAEQEEALEKDAARLVELTIDPKKERMRKKLDGIIHDESKLLEDREIHLSGDQLGTRGIARTFRHVDTMQKKFWENIERVMFLRFFR